MERNTCAGLNPFVDGYLEDLGFLSHLLSIALFTSIGGIDRFPRTPTIPAHSLGLGKGPGAHLAHVHLHATAIARGAFDFRASFLAASASIRS